MIYLRDRRIFYFGVTFKKVLLSTKKEPHFYFVCDLLLKYYMAKWNPFAVFYTYQARFNKFYESPQGKARSVTAMAPWQFLNQKSK